MGAVLVSVAHVVTGGCAEAYGGVMLVFEGHAALGAIPIWVACMATGGHGDKLGCYRGPRVLPKPGSVLISLTHVAVRALMDVPGWAATCDHVGHVGVQRLCSWQCQADLDGQYCQLGSWYRPDKGCG